jgi:uncharacterized membrane protein YfcA
MNQYQHQQDDPYHPHDPSLVRKERKLRFLSVLRPLSVTAGIVIILTVIFILFPYKPPVGIEPAAEAMPLLSWASLLIFLLGFMSGYFDSSIGMGYGTTLAPVLLLLGYHPMQVVPAILVSELLAAGTATFAHHSFGNADFRPGTRDFKVGIILGTCSLIGAVTAVVVAISVPPIFIKTWIAGVVLLVGVIILTHVDRVIPFGWWKMLVFGLGASFNKGLTGGGYGPLVTGAQLLSGVRSKTAVAITALGEGITCAVGAVMYYLTCKSIDWSLTPPLILGVLCAVPFAALTVRLLEARTLTILIGFVTIILGTVTLLKVWVF